MATLSELLKDYNSEHIEKYVSYCERLKTEKNRDGTVKNLWTKNLSDEKLANFYKRVAKDGLVFDGVHITLQSTGISYDYVAYKNKMLLVYPESVIDLNLIYVGDEYSFQKKDGKVEYTHVLKDPFNQKDEHIFGGYAVIKNRRGEYLTVMSKEDFEKHRKIAKTDFIWKDWKAQMCLKTIMKRACKQHFADVYENIDSNDNEQYDLDYPIELGLKIKQEIDELKSRDELEEYYREHSGKGEAIDKYLTLKLQSFKQQNND